MSLEEALKDSYFGFNNILFNYWRNGGPFDYKDRFNIKKFMFEASSEKVLDKETLRLLEVDNLHSAIDNTKTTLGKYSLYSSLLNPPTNLELILEKQDAVRELASNEKLRSSLNEFLEVAKEFENNALEFMYSPYDNIFTNYEGVNQVKKSIRKINLAIDDFPSTNSIYLDKLFSSLKKFDETEICRLMKGNAYVTFKGLKSRKNVNFFTLRNKARGSYLSFGYLVALSPIIGMSTGVLNEQFIEDYHPFSTMFVIQGPFIMGAIKLIYDRVAHLSPLSNKMIKSNELSNFLETLGKIDEINSFCLYGDELRNQLSNDVCLPNVVDEKYHQFVAKEVRNPILVKKLAGENLEYVPNDLNLNGSRLTVVTGPNSGGKTSFCKTLIQNQLLAQIGNYVLAKVAKVNVAERIEYQAPLFDSLHDDDGRFGTEMKRTKKIFFRTKPKSLIALDELSEGTTFSEKLELSYELLKDFYQIGGNTILVTHNSPLANKLKSEEIGQYFMVGFSGFDPTYKLERGISTTSHARRVVRNMAFDSVSRRDYLLELGCVD